MPLLDDIYLKETQPGRESMLVHYKIHAISSLTQPKHIFSIIKNEHGQWIVHND